MPEYIRKVIQEEEEAFRHRQVSKMTDLENTLILKVYFQLAVKTIEIMKDSSLTLLFEKCKEMFSISTFKELPENPKMYDKVTYIREGNLRIRLFNPVNDTKLDTYRGKEE